MAGIKVSDELIFTGIDVPVTRARLIWDDNDNPILNIVATKNELHELDEKFVEYATNDSLKEYAKTSDLSEYAPLNALTEFATKDEIPSPVDLSGYATKDEVNNAGYLTEHQDLSEYIKLADFIPTYSDVELSLKTFNASGAIFEFKPSIGAKQLVFNPMPTVNINGTACAVSMSNGKWVATASEDVRNNDNTMVLLIEGKINGVDVSYTKEVSAYKLPVKCGFQVEKTFNINNLQEAYIQELDGTEMTIYNNLDGQKLYAAIPRTFNTHSNENIVFLQDTVNVLNTFEMDYVSSTADYDIYRYKTAQLAGNTYYLKFKIK